MQDRGRFSTGRKPEQLFGQALRELRKQRGLSQETLAFESGYHPTYIGQLERGKKNPSLRAIVSLASVLQVLPSELIHRFEQLNERHRSEPHRRR